MRRARRMCWGCRVAMGACVVAWAVSFQWTGFVHRSGRTAVGVAAGTVFYSTSTLPPGNIFTPGPVIYDTPPGRAYVLRPAACPVLWRPVVTRWSTATIIGIPLWIAASVFAVGDAAFWLISRRRRVRGECVRCGYTRAGLPPGAACPECGAGAAPAVG